MRIAVQRSQELARILALPTREWESRGEELSRTMTAHLTLPGHRCRKGCAELNNVSVVKLRPWQAACLAELHDTGGAYSQAGVGDGKTLVSMIAGPVLCADRILLVVPAELRDDTWRKFAKLREHWQYLPMHVVSYEFLSVRKNKDYLHRYFLDCKRGLLIFDEAHEVAGVKRPGRAGSARGRLVDDFIDEWRAEEARTGVQTLSVLDMSGTPVNRSMRDCQPLMKWAQPHACPLPLEESDIIQWSGAIDEKVKPEERLDIGALKVFADTQTDGDELARVRKGLARRMFATPGIIAAPATPVSASLRVELKELHLTQTEQSAFEGLRRADEAETPDGWPIVDEVERWRHARSLGNGGFFYTWDPRPPEWWAEPRKRYFAQVREVIANNHRRLYTEGQVRHDILEAIRGRKCPACKKRTTLEVCEGLEWVPAAQAYVDGDEGLSDVPCGDYVGVPTHAPTATEAAHKTHPLADAWQAWDAVRGGFVPNTVPVWVGTTALDAAAEWAARAPGIVWVAHRAFAIELARRTGMRYYAKRGLDAGGRPIEQAKPSDGSIIASVDSNATGRNLQAWDRGYMQISPPTGKIIQQLIGREHRPGQLSDVVRFEIAVGCREALEGFYQAKRDCQWAGDMQESKPKLAIADIIEPEWKRVGLPWAVPKKGAEKKREVRAAIEALRPRD